MFGCSSSSCRSWPITTLRYWVSAVCAVPPKPRSGFCFGQKRDRRASPERKHSNSFGVSLISMPASRTRWRTAVDPPAPDHNNRNFSLALHSLTKSAVRIRAISSADIDGLFDW